MSNALTPRQQQILATLREIIQRTGIPPTRAELARTLGFRSANAAEDHLKALARKGAIELSSGTSRGIRLVEGAATATEAASAAASQGAPTEGPGRWSSQPTGKPTVGPSLAKLAQGLRSSVEPMTRRLLPVLGRVAAGQPMLAAEHITRQVEVDPELFHEAPDYLLSVRGLSMRDAGILEGDWVAVRRTQDAHPGQIVVARLGDEVTVKRLQKTRGGWQLLAENPDFAPITVDASQDFHLEGIVVGLIRPGPRW